MPEHSRFWTVVSALGLMRQNDAAAYYNMLGDDVLYFMDEGYADNSKPLWLNLGYWKAARTYPDACVAMVELLGKRAGLGQAIAFSTSARVSRNRTLFFSIASRSLTSRPSTSRPSTSTRAANASPIADSRSRSKSDSVRRPQWISPMRRSRKSWLWNAHFTSTHVSTSCAKLFVSSNPEGLWRSPTCSRSQARNQASQPHSAESTATFPKKISMIGRNIPGGWLPWDSTMFSWNRSGKTCSLAWPSTFGNAFAKRRRCTK